MVTASASLSRLQRRIYGRFAAKKEGPGLALPPGDLVASGDFSHFSVLAGKSHRRGG